jgi:hypothetical protein
MFSLTTEIIVLIEMVLAVKGEFASIKNKEVEN